MRTLFSSVDSRKVIGLSELSQLTGFNRYTLYRLIATGELPAFRVGRSRKHKWRFHREDLEIWWKNIHL
jgi:excisionase family DNA binding protein